jgi:cation transport ATPase
LKLRELRARSTHLGACTSCPLLRSDLEDAAIEIKDLKHKLDHSSRYTVLSPPCEACVSLMGKLLHATKENTELQQEVAYLTARLDKTALSEKNEKSAPKFFPSSNYHKEDEALKPTKAHYPSNAKPSFNPKREARKETLSQERKILCACFVAVLVTWMSFASGGRELRGGMLSMLETHIVMSLLIFRHVLILMLRLTFTLVLLLTLSHVLCLALLLVLHLSSLMDPTITHMVSVHERTTLSLDALVTTQVLIVVIISRVGLVFPLESPSPTLS